MKFALKLAVALAVGAVCVALVLRQTDAHATWRALSQVSAPTIVIYLGTLLVTHILRVWRWEFLLRPIGVSLRWPHLFPISSVGIMAILWLPVRLGEFVRPYFVVRLGKSRMSAVLGTVAVERIVDGLLISVFFFGSYLAAGRETWPAGLRFAAWLSLLGFVAATLFLAFALRWTEPTIRLALAISFLPTLSPRLATKVADRLRALIAGFRVLHDPRNLIPFLAQSLLYWTVNGFGMWVLARRMDLDIPPIAAYTSMAFTGVLVSLPNSPGLMGQFHLGVLEGLRPYVQDETVIQSTGVAYALLVHGIQFVWFTLVGLACLRFLPGGSHALRQAVIDTNRAEEPPAPGPLVEGEARP